MEEGESLAAAAARELREEAGLDVKDLLLYTQVGGQTGVHWDGPLPLGVLGSGGHRLTNRCGEGC